MILCLRKRDLPASCWKWSPCLRESRAGCVFPACCGVWSARAAGCCGGRSPRWRPRRWRCAHDSRPRRPRTPSPSLWSGPAIKGKRRYHINAQIFSISRLSERNETLERLEYPSYLLRGYVECESSEVHFGVVLDARQYEENACKR